MRVGSAICLLSLLTLMVAAPAEAVNQSTMSFGCAPWDGRTLELHIGAPDIMIDIEIWAMGYDSLEKGVRTIAIDNKFTDGTGRASVRETRHPHDPKEVPTDATVTVHFDALELKEGGKASGYVEEKDGMKWPFEGVIHGTQLCG